MRNLFHFVIRFNYIFVLLILESISFIFVIRNHSYQRVGFLNSAGAVTGGMSNMYNQFGEYLSLGRVNDKLMEENAKLMQLNSLPVDSLVSIEQKDDSSHVHYRFIPVKAINFTVNRATNYITLSKGKKAGIKRDMGVITGTGIVGIVNHVSDNFSTAMSVLHKDCPVSIKVKRFNYPGTLQWDGGSPLEAEITGIPKHLPITLGDSVITSGFSAIFPENIPVGVISELNLPKGKSFFTVKVKLAANLESLQYAYVVENLFQQEQRTLEEQNQ